jgi:hypothetical protein
MSQNTRVYRFEILLAKQIRSGLLLGRDWRIWNRQFGSRVHRPNLKQCIPQAAGSKRHFVRGRDSGGLRDTLPLN